MYLNVHTVKTTFIVKTKFWFNSFDELKGRKYSKISVMFTVPKEGLWQKALIVSSLRDNKEKSAEALIEPYSTMPV